ncbi:MAG TPA: DUF6518 family protein [Acidimicrobiales bacterium]|nr:DUF6518 family protein [Acidimicrobiales bacterium]
MSRRRAAARSLASWTGTLGAGAILGVASRLGDDLVGGWAWIANIGGPWLVAAFVLGTLARSPRTAAAWGTLALLSAVGSYYTWIALVQDGAGRQHLGWLVALWVVVGAGAGTAFGAAGWAWRTGPGPARLVGAGLLSSALVGEAAVLLAGESAGVQAVFLAELVVGGALPWALLRHPRDVAGSAVLAATFLPAAVVGTAAVMAAAARLAS